MPKIRTIFACQKCGAQAPKWLGRCPDCGAWNSLIEESFSPPSERENNPNFFTLRTDTPVPLPAIAAESKMRHPVGDAELDRVLGGGLVPGSLVLLGGDPGIGKSTLILQALDRLAKSGLTVLYATGEESAAQIKIRADRLGLASEVLVLAENSADRIIEQVRKIKPQILVVDSIQTVYLAELASAPGSVSQVRETAGKLLYLSKATGVTTILIGHVTKEGSLAGPRVLEHLVDCVLYFEGDAQHQFRILRSIKNRYGSTNEIGVFEMTDHGLDPITNPAGLFLPETHSPGPGSVITAALEGRRPFLVEIQALVSSSVLTNPRRTTLGVDPGRVAIIIAVLEKITGLNLYPQDVYIATAGGFKVIEPAADLAILMALASSFQNKPMIASCVVLGEVGLAGEIRPTHGLDLRLNEAAKMGMKRCILPKSKKKKLPSSPLELVGVESVTGVLDLY